MIRKIPAALLAVYLLLGCGLRWKDEGPPPRQESRSPEIIHYEAEEVIRPGETWRVYLKLRDVDCDMAYIVTHLWQSGVGAYPVSFTPIRQHVCPDIVGYIFLRTPADRSLIWNQYEAKIVVRDRRGNYSKSITLPLNFDLIGSKELPDEWQGQPAVSLGAIMINLENTQRSETGG